MKVNAPKEAVDIASDPILGDAPAAKLRKDVKVPNGCLILDIETGADEFSATLSFDEKSVKYGRMVDEEKRANKRQEVFDKHMELAALDPVCAEVLGFGVIDQVGLRSEIAGRSSTNSPTNESNILKSLWERIDAASLVIGHNIKDFDLFFLWQRSIILGVPFPRHYLQRGRYWDGKFIDIAEVWLCGKRRTDVRWSLDYICATCGLPGKTGSGKDFRDKWISERDEAHGYIQDDMLCTFALAKHLNLF